MLLLISDKLHLLKEDRGPIIEMLFACTLRRVRWWMCKWGCAEGVQVPPLIIAQGPNIDRGPC